MYRAVSGPCLVVSPARVVMASAFQSVMTVGSSVDVVVAAGAAVATPVASVLRSNAAAQAASHPALGGSP
jgi:hypothetical protein